MEAVQLEREDGIERRRLDVVAFAVVGFGRCDDGGAFVLLEPDFRQHIPVTGQCAADILRQRIPQQAADHRVHSRHHRQRVDGIEIGFNALQRPITILPSRRLGKRVAIYRSRSSVYGTASSSRKASSFM